ncbi:hypothetical protein ACYT69_11440, partial [Streptococcus pyogenes]
DGQRAYDRARKGEDVEMKARAVTIHSLRHAGLDPASIAPDEQWTPDQVRGDEAEEARLASITLTAHVSKGTYIRSLARDIARAV